MKVEIEIRDTDAHGKRLGMRNAIVKKCNVYKQAGDGLRMDNLAEPARIAFLSFACKVCKEWRDSVNTH